MEIKSRSRRSVRKSRRFPERERESVERKAGAQASQGLQKHWHMNVKGKDATPTTIARSVQSGDRYGLSPTPL